MVTTVVSNGPNAQGLESISIPTKARNDFAGANSGSVDRKNELGNGRMLYVGATVAYRSLPAEFLATALLAQVEMQKIFKPGAENESFVDSLAKVAVGQNVRTEDLSDRYEPHLISKIHITAEVLVRGQPTPQDIDDIDVTFGHIPGGDAAGISRAQFMVGSGERSGAEYRSQVLDDFEQRIKLLAAREEVGGDVVPWLSKLRSDLAPQPLRFDYDEMFIGKDGNHVIALVETTGQFAAFRSAIRGVVTPKYKDAAKKLDRAFVVIGKITGSEQLNADERHGVAEVLRKANESTDSEYVVEAGPELLHSRQRNLLSVSKKAVL